MRKLVLALGVLLSYIASAQDTYMMPSFAGVKAFISGWME